MYVQVKPNKGFSTGSAPRAILTVVEQIIYIYIQFIISYLPTASFFIYFLLKLLTLHE